MDEKEDYKIYLQWWQACGEIANPQVEYMAWKAGRDFQIEKSAQQPLAPDGATCAAPECGGDMEASLTCKVCGATRPAGKA